MGESLDIYRIQNIALRIILSKNDTSYEDDLKSPVILKLRVKEEVNCH